jgi:hypothetical protein
MIKVILRGGLGNQMFQYALGVALAEKNKVPLVIDTTLLNDRLPRKEITFRKFDLDIFGIQPKLSFFSKLSQAMPIPGLWVLLDMTSDKILQIFGMREKINEAHEYEFDDHVLESGKNSTLWGLWQSESYFAEYRKKIFALFQFKYPLEGEAKKIGEVIVHSNSVSIHVRRGDYVTHKSVLNTLGSVGIPYYQRAADYMAEHIENPHFFIFSNDIDWCKENLKLSFPATYLGDDTAGPKASFHLELMSLCKNNIIANSTFSWWGAWLNRNPKKIVIAPEKWRAAGSRGKDDIIPDAWIKL